MAWFIVLLFVGLISWVCVGIFCGLTDDNSVTNKDVEIIDAYRAIPKMLVIGELHPPKGRVLPDSMTSLA